MFSAFPHPTSVLLPSGYCCLCYLKDRYTDTLSPKIFCLVLSLEGQFLGGSRHWQPGLYTVRLFLYLEKNTLIMYLSSIFRTMQSALRIKNKKPKVIMFKTQRLQACGEFCRDISSDANRSRETPVNNIDE